MTRILYWNIQNFTSSKIEGYKRLDLDTAADDRKQHILDIIAAPQTVRDPPDMVIIVEVWARNLDVTTSGIVLPSDVNAAQGLTNLLEGVRGKLGDAWCLIPPIMCGMYGKREAVGVFYNSAALTFAGPCIYATDGRDDIRKSMPAVPANLPNIRSYDAVYRKYLPDITPERTWDANGTPVLESQGAGQVQFAGVRFKDEADRPPFYVRMRDSADRMIHVFTVHTSPGSAAAAVVTISGIPELTGIAANEVKVVVGDFNVDPFIRTKKILYADPYSFIRQEGYKMLLSPFYNGQISQDRLPYCLTHLLPNRRMVRNKRTNIATPYNANNVQPDPTHNVYPRLGYMGGMSSAKTPKPNDTGAIDNVFVKRPAGQTAPFNTTIANPVVGSPYTAVQPPAAVTPDLTSGLQQPIKMIMAQPFMRSTGFDPGTDIGEFNSWAAYGHIYAVSDHLAIIFDV